MGIGWIDWIDPVRFIGEGGAGPFQPADLFADGQDGGVWDISNVASLFQDAAATIPVTQDGDRVGRIVDASGRGRDMTQNVNEARPTYRTDGQYHWVEFNGVDQVLRLPPMTIGPPGFDECIAYDTNGDKDGRLLFSTSPSTMGFRYAEGQVVVGGPVFPFSTVTLVRVDGVQRHSGTGLLANNLYTYMNGKHVTTMGLNTPMNPAVYNWLFGAAAANAPTQWLSGRLYGMCLRTRMTDQERLTIEHWLAARAGVAMLA